MLSMMRMSSYCSSYAGRLARHSGTESKTPCPFVRLSFVVCKEEDIHVAIERFAGLLKTFHGQNMSLPPQIGTDGRPAAGEETL